MQRAVTQAEFGAAVGVTQQAVSELVRAGVLPDGGTFADWLLAYCGRLREQAAGRMGWTEGGLDLTQERAALAREQRMGIEIKNALARREYAPVRLLAEVLATASQAVAERFEHLPGHLKKACPEMTDSQRDQVGAVIAAAKNEWIRSTADLVATQLEQDDADDVLPDDDDEPRAD